MNVMSTITGWPWPLLALWFGAFVWTAAPFTFFAIRRIRKGGYIFRPQFPDAVFTENWTSGRSCQGLTHYLGAGNCYWVTVTRDLLAVGAHFPFSLMADLSGLDYCIQAEDIIRVEQRKPRLRRARAIISFRGADGEQSFELILKKLDGFFAAMQSMLCNSQAGRGQQPPAVISKYKVGQVWTYKNRPGEGNSRLTIVRVEPFGQAIVVHVHISGLAVPNPQAPHGQTSVIAHMPFAEAAIDASVAQLVEHVEQLPDFQDGYKMWKTEADAGKAGIFTITVAQAIDGITSAFA